MSNVEIHFHLLPGVDDGPPRMADSVALARVTVADGTALLIATPHVHSEMFTDPESIAARTLVVNEELERQGLPLTVLPGGELDHALVSRLTVSQLELIAQGPAGRRWLLVEAPFRGLRMDFSAATDALRAKGFAVVVAHPERARPTPETGAVMEHEIACGSGLQLTAASIVGDHGRPARELSLRLIRSASRALVASDAHGLWRPPMLTAAVAALAEAGIPEPTRFVSDVPRAMIERGLDIWSAARVA